MNSSGFHTVVFSSFISLWVLGRAKSLRKKEFKEDLNLSSTQIGLFISAPLFLNIATGPTEGEGRNYFVLIWIAPSSRKAASRRG